MVETFRRLVLTAVMSVCAPGTSSQAVFSLLVSLFYIKVYGYYSPYSERQDSVLAETGQFQVFFTFYVGLIMQNSLLPDFWNSSLGIILIVINFGVIYYTFYVELNNVLQSDESPVEDEVIIDKSTEACGDIEMRDNSIWTGLKEKNGLSFDYGSDSDDDSDFGDSSPETEPK